MKFKSALGWTSVAGNHFIIPWNLKIMQSLPDESNFGGLGYVLCTSGLLDRYYFGIGELSINVAV